MLYCLVRFVVLVVFVTIIVIVALLCQSNLSQLHGARPKVTPYLIAARIILPAARTLRRVLLKVLAVVAAVATTTAVR